MPGQPVILLPCSSTLLSEVNTNPPWVVSPWAVGALAMDRATVQVSRPNARLLGWVLIPPE